MGNLYGNKSDVNTGITGQRPISPGFSFEIGDIKLGYVAQVVTNAHTKSLLGINSICYKLYKKCPDILEILTKVLNKIWQDPR